MASDYSIPKDEYRALLDTNAKLRDELTDVYMQLGGAWSRCTELRELCAYLYKHFHGVVCENWAYTSEDFRIYEQRMRDLGVEVDNGA